MTGFRHAALALALSSAAGPAAPELSGTGWVNAQDLDLERFRGKVVLLYFFEATCTNGRERIPELNDLRRKYIGKPVVFIAVNSGNPRAAVEDHARSTKFEWPILVDELRETEGNYGRKISLSCIYWYFVVAPDGAYREFGADQNAAESRIEELLPGARTLLQGIDVPNELRLAANRLEAGQMGEPVRDLFRALGKNDSAVSEAAHRMYLRILPLGESRLKRSKDLQAAGDAIAAFDGFTRLMRDFPGTPLAEEAQKGVEGLRQEKEVRAELKARRLLDQARSILEMGKRARPQARAILESLSRSSLEIPSVEAARRLLKSLD